MGAAAEDDGANDELCFVTVAGFKIPGAIYRDHQRDVQDWASGIKLEDAAGRMIRDNSGYPQEVLAAGVRTISVVGLSHHPDAQRPEFAFGSHVRVVADPTNPVNPRAIAIRSADGRYLAGYVPDAELDEAWDGLRLPAPGLIVWEHFTWRPRKRIGLRVVAGPAVALTLVPANQRRAEFARRKQFHEAVRAVEERQHAEARERQEQERRRVAAEKEARARARVDERWQREASQARAKQWRIDGLCIECGAPIERATGRGRPPVRCAVHAAGDRARRIADR